MDRKDARVRMLVSQEDVQTARVEALVDSTFEGSASDLIALLKKRYLNK